MGTSATIAYRKPNGSWQGVYNHYDGDTLQPRIEAAIRQLGIEKVKRLIERTRNGFVFFDPAKSEKSLGGVADMHSVMKDGPDTTIIGWGTDRRPSWAEYVYIIEPDGTVTVLA